MFETICIPKADYQLLAACDSGARNEIRTYPSTTMNSSIAGSIEYLHLLIAFQCGH